MPGMLQIIVTLAGHTIEQVKVYKYLGVWVDDKLSFTVHVENMIRKLKLKIGFYYRHKACFSFMARKELVRCTLLSAGHHWPCVGLNTGIHWFIRPFWLKMPFYLCSFLVRSVNKYQLRSHSDLLLKVPKIRTGHGRNSFSFSTVVLEFSPEHFKIVTSWP